MIPFWLALIGRIVSAFSPIVVVLMGGSTLHKCIVAALAVFILGALDHILIFRPQKKFEAKRKELLDVYFEDLIAKAAAENAKLRVNLMLVKWGLTGRR